MVKDVHSGGRQESSDLEEEEGLPREKSKGREHGEKGADADKGEHLSHRACSKVCQLETLASISHLD